MGGFSSRAPALGSLQAHLFPTRSARAGFQARVRSRHDFMLHARLGALPKPRPAPSTAASRPRRGGSALRAAAAGGEPASQTPSAPMPLAGLAGEFGIVPLSWCSHPISLALKPLACCLPWGTARRPQAHMGEGAVGHGAHRGLPALNAAWAASMLGQGHLGALHWAQEMPLCVCQCPSVGFAQNDLAVVT